MERKYIGFTIDNDSYSELSKLSVEPDAIHYAKAHKGITQSISTPFSQGTVGILHTGIPLERGKLYHFEVRIGQSKPISTYLAIGISDITDDDRWMMCDDDNSSFDSLRKVWHHSWRFKLPLPSTGTTSVGVDGVGDGIVATQILFGIKSKCLDDQLEILHSKILDNFVSVVEVDTDECAIGKLSDKVTREGIKFTDLHRRITTSCANNIEQRLAFFNQSTIQLLDDTKGAISAPTPEVGKYTCYIPAAFNLQLHSKFTSQLFNIASHMHPATDVILWSNPWKNKFHRLIQESMAPVSKCLNELVNLLSFVELTRIPFSLSDRAREYYLSTAIPPSGQLLLGGGQLSLGSELGSSARPSVGERLKQTLLKFSSTSEFCNPSLIEVVSSELEGGGVTDSSCTLEFRSHSRSASASSASSLSPMASPHSRRLSLSTLSPPASPLSSLYMNVKTGEYTLLPNDDSAATRVTAVVILDDCMYSTKEVKESIDSLCKQTYRNLEIFVLQLNPPTDTTTSTGADTDATANAAISDLIGKMAEDDLRIRIDYSSLTQVLKDSTGNFILFQHVKMVSLPTRVSKQLEALMFADTESKRPPSTVSSSTVSSILAVSCERGVKSSSAIPTTTINRSYESKVRSQVNGYEIALYNKSKLLAALDVGHGVTSAASSRAKKSLSSSSYPHSLSTLGNYSTLLFTMFSGLIHATSATAPTLLQDTLITQSQYTFYSTVAEVLVKQ